MKEEIKLSPVETLIDRMKNSPISEIARELEREFGHPFTISQVCGHKARLIQKERNQLSRGEEKPNVPPATSLLRPRTV